MKVIFKLILEVFLLIVGVPIFTVLFIVGIFYSFFKHVIKGDYLLEKQFTPIIRSVNLIFDGLANAGAGELLNDCLRIKGTVIRFGKWYETISAVTGLIKKFEKDTWLRRFLKILGKNHCEEAITEMQDFYYTNKFNEYEKTN